MRPSLSNPWRRDDSAKRTNHELHRTLDPNRKYHQRKPITIKLNEQKILYKLSQPYGDNIAYTLYIYIIWFYRFPCVFCISEYSIGSRIFLAQGGRVLEDWGGVCVTISYESFDRSKEGCKRLRASANEIFSVYLRVTMSYSIFHFGQSLDIATWSSWQFTHFGSFW